VRALVLRVAAIMAAVVVGCALVFAAVSLPRRASADPFPGFLLKAGLGAAQRRLDALDPADRPAELQRLRADIELPLALEGSDSPQPEPQHRFGPGGARFYLPLDGGRTQLVVGPLDLPAPDRFAVTVGILVSGILVSGAALGVVWPLARRLEAIESGMNALEGGELDVRVSDARSDLVGRLGAGFDRMASALQRRMRDREELLHAVAHELGTPRSRVALHAELLRGRLPEDARGRVDALRIDLDELDRLTAELVDWVQLDGPHRSAELEVFDAAEAIRREVECVADGRVECVLPARLLARGDTRLFRRAVGNLLRNAVEHAHSWIVRRPAGRVRHGRDGRDGRGDGSRLRGARRGRCLRGGHGWDGHRRHLPERGRRQLLRSLRGERSQTALSRRLSFTTNVVYTWEAGRRSPPFTANTLRASLGNLHTGAGERRCCGSRWVGWRQPRAARRSRPDLAGGWRVGCADRVLSDGADAARRSPARAPVSALRVTPPRA
jgi:HAMP domain-containing protein